MHQARWNRIEELLQSALDLEPAARAGFLSRSCGSDRELRAELESLLAREAEGSLLETPAIMTVAPQLAHEPEAGDQIGRYRIVKRIGSGGMGDVYEARDETLQRTVALKVLPAEFIDDPERVARLEREAVAASRLNHPNIVTIHEVVHSGDRHCIVTERIEGRTLRDVLARGALPVEQAVDLTMQIASALKAAHTAWTIHRDIKPENVMVRSDGLVKVVDFGIAKLRDEVRDQRGPPLAGKTNLTASGAVVGTTSYMSPEQALGETLDGRTDLYSLGLVLYEMLTGERFAGDVARLERVPRELQRIVRKMLQPDREARHASAVELLDDLTSVRRVMQSRSARRMAVWGATAFGIALLVTCAAALLSITETWEEQILRDGHTAAARQIAFSPDGRFVVSCGEDARVIVWEFASRQRLAILDHSAVKVAYAPDGATFASGGTDGSVVIWDAKSRRARQRFRVGRSDIGLLAFSPDGATLVASVAWPAEGTVLWDVRRSRVMRTVQFATAHGNAVFSADASHALFSTNMTAVELATGQVVGTESPNGNNWIALAPDQSQVAAIDPYGDVLFFRLPVPGDLRRHELVGRAPLAHQDHGRAIAFSPDGRLLASASEEIILWDAESHQKVGRFEHTAIVWSIAFSPDGRSLLSSHGDGAVLVWDVAERKRVANLNEHSGAVRAVAFSPDGARLASAGEDRMVMLWDLVRGRKEAVLAKHATRVTAVAFSGASEVVSADQNGEVIVWDTRQRKPRRTIPPPGHVGAIYALDVMADRRLVACSHGVYSLADGRRVLPLTSALRIWVAEQGQMYGLAFDPRGKEILAATETGWILRWDLERRELIDKVLVPGERHVALDLAPDGKSFVTGEDDGGVRLWSVAPLRSLGEIGRHRARVKAVAFSPDGAAIASAGDDKVIAIWDVKRRALRTRVGTHATPVYAVAFSPDGRRLASGEHDHSVRVYTRRRRLWGMELQ